MISLEEARDRLLASILPLAAEEAPLRDCAGRYLAATLPSPIDLPLFDNSAMDGYAVRAADLAAASAEQPVTLPLAGIVPAGGNFDGSVPSGSCVRIFTGSPLPAGCDAVVMQEDAEASAEGARFAEPARPLENVRLRGEDIRAGTVIGQAGDRIDPARLGVFAACGLSAAPVHRRPRVALLATGSELREPGQTLRPGQIYESNRAMLSPLIQALGCDVSVHPLVPDRREDTQQALAGAFAKSDVVITTGGVSVGEFDFVKECFSALGGKIEIWKVALRPGKPFAFGSLGPRFLFGLPGNPVSALVTFALLVRPALLRLQNARVLSLPLLPGRLVDSIHNRGDRRHFMRVCWSQGEVRVCGPQASHMLGSLLGSQALLEVPPHAHLAVGTAVTVHVWDPAGL